MSAFGKKGYDSRIHGLRCRSTRGPSTPSFAPQTQRHGRTIRKSFRRLRPQTRGGIKIHERVCPRRRARRWRSDIKASHDRVTVIFSTIFREETDRVFGKVFLQEFVDARRRAIQNAPQVLFRNEPPLELQGVRGLADGTNGEVGYVTFGNADWPIVMGLQLTDSSTVSQASHTSTEARNHLPYPDLPRLLPLSYQSFKGEIFCQPYAVVRADIPQAYIHSRMRRRTADFLQGQ